MEIKALLIEKFDTQQISDAFKKREFVVEYASNPSYPEFIKFELIQDKCDLIDGFNANQEIIIHFNLKGRKWTDPQGNVKYFNTLQAWKLEKANDVTMSAGPDSSDSGAIPPPAPMDSFSSSDSDKAASDYDADDLPF